MPAWSKPFDTGWDWSLNLWVGLNTWDEQLKRGLFQLMDSGGFSSWSAGLIVLILVARHKQHGGRAWLRKVVGLMVTKETQREKGPEQIQPSKAQWHISSKEATRLSQFPIVPEAVTSSPWAPTGIISRDRILLVIPIFKICSCKKSIQTPGLGSSLWQVSLVSAWDLASLFFSFSWWFINTERNQSAKVALENIRIL